MISIDLFIHILFLVSALICFVLIWLRIANKWHVPAKIILCIAFVLTMLLIPVAAERMIIRVSWYLWLIILLFITSSGFGQAELAKKDKLIVGLILPICSFSVSVVACGLSITNNLFSFEYAIKGGISWFMVLNIPTIVWLVIFGIFHKGNKTKKEFEKMNILDLE